MAGICSFADLDDPNVDATLSRLASFPHVKGVRQLLNYDAARPEISNPVDLLASSTWQANYALLAKHGLHFEFHGFACQLSEGAALAARHPHIPLIVNHSGLCIDHTEEGIELWKRGLQQLAQQPNVSMKISGLGMTDNSWTAESIRPFVADLLACFGPERCMFASNYPVEKCVGQYGDWYTAFKQIVAARPQHEQRLLFHDNAIRFYRL